MGYQSFECLWRWYAGACGMFAGSLLLRDGRQWCSSSSRCLSPTISAHCQPARPSLAYTAHPPLGRRLQWNVSVHHVKDLPPEEEQRLKESQFYWDMNHPWDRTGHRWVQSLAVL